MDDTRKLKGLKSQISGLKQDASVIKSEIGDKKKLLKLKSEQIVKKQQEINKLEHNGNIKVSEHAMLRYLERVKGIDLHEIEKEIITEDIVKWVEMLGGNGSYPNKNFSIKMKNGIVTTIY